jgi:vacuolar-type H+-ATPase subunit H
VKLIGRRNLADEEESSMDDDASEETPEEESQDLLTLLDRLERALTSAGRVPMTGRLLVDEEAMYAILDQIRTSGQAGIRQARAIVRHRDQIIDESQQEAARIVADATVQADATVAEDGLAERSARRARELLDDAERQAREVEADADQYAGQVLLALRERLHRIQLLLQEDDIATE